MIVFQDEPDPIFLTIVDEALSHVRQVHLLRYRKGYRQTRAERRELEASYRELFPEIVAFFTGREVVSRSTGSGARAARSAGATSCLHGGGSPRAALEAT